MARLHHISFVLLCKEKMKIQFINRQSGQVEEEQVYGDGILRLLYGKRLFSRLLSWVLFPIVVHCHFLSHFYGFLQKRWWTRKKVRPFVNRYHIDATEFVKEIDAFTSFNDFFIRHLRPECRPIALGADVVTMPADARYLVYPNVKNAEGFVVKGKKFSLLQLLKDYRLEERYQEGTMVIARLCPTDYHRFHFPCNGIPSKAQLINGPLFSVNPIALLKNIDILAENKRMLTEIETKHFGKLLFIEVGATHVGSIHQTYLPKVQCAKGEEKGYFSFGGSTLILLFEPGRIQLDQDLVDASKKQMEVRGLMGQSLGRALTPF